MSRSHTHRSDTSECPSSRRQGTRTKLALQERIPVGRTRQTRPMRPGHSPRNRLGHPRLVQPPIRIQLDPEMRQAKRTTWFQSQNAASSPPFSSPRAGVSRPRGRPSFKRTTRVAWGLRGARSRARFADGQPGTPCADRDARPFTDNVSSRDRPPDFVHRQQELLRMGILASEPTVMRILREH